MSVTELGFVGLSVSDLGAWRAFAGEVLGLEVVPVSPRAVQLRMDHWHHRFLVRESGADDVDCIGWRVAGPPELDALKRRLAEAGIACREASPQEAAERERLGFITFTEPGGVTTEVFYGPRIEPGLPFYPGRRMHGPFVTGPGGLGHVVIEQPDPGRAEAFYSGVLGMRGSLELERDIPGGRLEIHFMSCNPRQHSLAFGAFNRGKRLSHIMTECARLEDVGLTRDMARRHRVPFRMEIGQHHNDGAVSFYLVTPSGWTWEVGWGVSPPSGQAAFARFDIWGHEQVAPPGAPAPASPTWAGQEG